MARKSRLVAYVKKAKEIKKEEPAKAPSDSKGVKNE